jgi:two-component system, OmpR family, sensor kinase
MRPRGRIGALLGSIRTRLAVFFFLITLIAVSVVYVYVTPALQSQLEQQQLKNTESLARSVDSDKRASSLAALEDREQVEEDAINTAGLEVAHLEKAKQPPPARLTNATRLANAARLAKAKKVYRTDQDALTRTTNKAVLALTTLARETNADNVVLLRFTQSANGSPSPHALLSVLPVASPTSQAGTAAFTSRLPTKQTVNSGLGLVAVPVAPKNDYVFVYSVNFANVLSDVVLIRRRILVAAAIALAVVLLLGVLVARALTVRVLRLERAAQRVAQGDLTAHFEVDAHDELGQLAAALAHMQSQLQELEQARRRFIATASHELRTPIFSLGGFLELIQDEELDEDTRRQFVGQVREQVARLGKLATGLLDLSRLEAGSIDLEPTPTDIGVLSRAVAAEFVPALTAHQSQLDLQLPETPLRAMVDPDRVAQLLRILIDNAITHTPEGSAVTVGVGDGDGTVRLSVSDNGPGIPDEAVARIFEPFYSADGAQGAGLGLAIARELAERLHGLLDVQSAAGATVFTVTLPGEVA